jgi:predicted ATPase
MRRALDAYRAAGQAIGLPLLLAMLAEGHAACGDFDGGLACVTEGRAAARASGEVRAVAELHRVEGSLLAARGDRRGAERCFRQAIAVARQHGERWWELRATTSLARLALDDGPQRSRRAARTELAALVAWFSEGFDTPDLREAQRLLGAETPRATTIRPPRWN